MAILAVGDGAEIGIPAGTKLALDIVDNQGVDWSAYPVLDQIVLPTPEEVTRFKLPDLYEMLPQVARNADTTLVPRTDIPLYFWDTAPVWDQAPYQWDQVLNPEPIMKTTVRVMQLELEKSADEICRLTKLFSIDDVPRDFLPHLSLTLGTPLPSANEEEQRVFLKRLFDTYRNKGTPLSFQRLFESLGFDLVLQEQYQRKLDAGFVGGPQIARVSTDVVQMEPVGTTAGIAGPYTFQLLNKPVARGSVRIRVNDQSANIPTIITDNGEGGWSGAVTGSIDYVTGSASLTLTAVPALLGQPIEVDYRYLPDSFPDPHELRFTDRFRSSSVGISLTPKDPTVVLTDELNQRLALYLGLLKPAHVVISGIDILFNFDEDEGANLSDTLDPPVSTLIVESLFGSLYHGYPWNSRGNASLHVDPAFLGQRHRTRGEFIRNQITDPNELGAPDVYPVKRNGKHHQPSAADDFRSLWDEVYETFPSTVTNDVAATTTQFSIAKGAGTTLGVGDVLVMSGGTAKGEQRTIQTFTDNTTFFTVVVPVALPVAPVVGDAVTILDDAAPKRNQLTVRKQDPLEMLFGEEALDSGNPPDGVRTGPFTVTVTNIPIAAGSTSRLRFTIGSTNFEETATGTGAFTNTSTHISTSNIDYTTGAVTVTFSTAPDNGSEVRVFYAIAATEELGTY